MSLAEGFQAGTPTSSQPVARHLRAVTPETVEARALDVRIYTPTPGTDPLARVQFHESFDLIDRASRGIVALVKRCRTLEQRVKQIEAWSTAKVQAAEDVAEHWKTKAAAAERKLEESQRSTEALVRRAESAERAAREDDAALEALQQRITAAFGFGSEAHDAVADWLDHQ